MKIGLNATCLNDRPSGAKQRFVGIYGELFKLLPDAEFVIYEPADCRVAAWFEGVANVSARRTSIPSEGRTQKFVKGFGYWNAALASERFDLFEGFHLPLVASPRGRNLLTIHDIRGVNSQAGFLKRLIYKPVLGRSLERADHVVTVSEAMKAELLTLHPGLQISVVYNGLDESKRSPVPADALVAFKQKFGAGEDFILAVGHMEKRKNYPCLVDAIRTLHDRGLNYPLVIIGNDSGQKDEIEARLEIAQLSGKVRLLTGLSDLEVRCAYQLCKLFVFPSTYEGFGIPILEAMAANRPMVLSDIPVFREITEDQGFYFPPESSDSMATAMQAVLCSNAEQQRLVDYGQKRIEAFNYEILAGQVKQLYESMM